MVLLAGVSCLLFFITYFTGIFTECFLAKSLKIHIKPDFFERFLLGLITSFVYFNLVSFFLPVNYIALLPLLLVSAATFSTKSVRHLFFAEAGQTVNFFFSKNHLFLTVPFIALLFFYWIIPPSNRDSGEYHYIAIRWYEQYKVVPGLANVHGRLAFNPANFIISAPYSFTDLAGQSLYPLNGILALLFYAWLIKKCIVKPATLYSFFIFIAAVFLFRITLVNITSPSSDMLCGILLFYCGFKTYEFIKAGKKTIDDYFTILVICCFSVTAKLSAIPSLLILPFIYFVLLKKRNDFSLLLKSMFPVILIIGPWLLRNFVLSGYLLYPVPATNILHVDWVAPKDVIQLDYIFSKYGPRTVTVDFAAMQRMNIVQLTVIWTQYMYEKYLFSLLITITAILSPFVWMLFPAFKKRISADVFMLWSIYYIAVWIWFINSPEHRFGLPYLLLAITLPLFELAQGINLKWKLYYFCISILTCFFCFYYSASALRKGQFYRFSVAACWLKPMRDHRYYQRNDLQTFQFMELKNGVKLYLPDDTHECLNAPGPCMNWRYGNIEMRGKKIEDGFRNTKDEVKKYWPFVDTGK